MSQATSSIPTESPHNVQRLLQRHYKIIDLAAAGHDVKTIAETLGMKPHSIGLILKSPLVQHELAKVRKQSKESEVLGMDREALRGKTLSILEQASVKAAEVVQELLEDVNPTVRLRASDSILDRVFGNQKDGHGMSTVINITAENVQLLHQALKESEYAVQNVKRHVECEPPANGAPAPDPEAPELGPVQGQADGG
jgi:HEAT repeat protein